MCKLPKGINCRRQFDQVVAFRDNMESTATVPANHYPIQEVKLLAASDESDFEECSSTSTLSGSFESPISDESPFLVSDENSISDETDIDTLQFDLETPLDLASCTCDYHQQSPSLTTSSTSPKRAPNKVVSFADNCGKSLVQVRTYDPHVDDAFGTTPSPVFSYFFYHLNQMNGVNDSRSPSSAPLLAGLPTTGDGQTASTSSNSAVGSTTSMEILEKQLLMQFPQPICDYEQFMMRIEKDNVSLESVVLSDLIFMGTVRVKNLSFAKRVFVRTTFDKWHSYTDFDAMFTSRCGDKMDIFSFLVECPSSLSVGSVIEFACCFEIPDRHQQFWDNNSGRNYSILVRADA